MWMSIGLGMGLALLYGLASVLTYRRALRAQTQQQFTAIAIGGVVLRILGTLAAFAVLIVWLPIAAGAFVGTFFVVFLMILIGEIAWLHRRANATPNKR